MALGFEDFYFTLRHGLAHIRPPGALRTYVRSLLGHSRRSKGSADNIYVCIYIYIYMERERERERQRVSESRDMQE